MATTRLLDGKPVAQALLEQARTQVAQGRAEGRVQPTLASLHRGGATPFSVYLKQQGKNAEAAGLLFRDVGLPDGADAHALRSKVEELDRDPAVHAVIVEHPLPAELDFTGAVRLLRPEKDVDGVGPVNLGLLVARHTVQAPAVALAALEIARHYGVDVTGRRVAVLGRSETVGIPLALLLLAKGKGADATVTVAHSRTPDLAASLAGASVIFSCVGSPGLLTRSNVPEGAAVIDVGTSTVPDSTRPSGVRIVGDADARSLDGWASALSPVPGGVGPITVARLMLNAVHGWKMLTGKGSH